MTERFETEVERLRTQLAEDRRTAAEVDDGLRRLRKSVDAPPTKRMRWLWAPAVAALVIAILLLRPRPPAPEPEHEPEHDRIQFVRGQDCVTRAASRLDVAPTCAEEIRVRVDNELVVPSPGTAFELTARGVHVERGRATFSVALRPTPQQPFEVIVSHGTIATLGARFTLAQRADVGRLTVEDGQVRFSWNDGSTRQDVASGESLAWPRLPTPPPPAPPTAAKTKAKAKTSPKTAPLPVDKLMKRLVRLRSQRRYDDAIELLSAASRRTDLSAVQRERLSWEIHAVLRDSGRNTEACRHLEAHLSRFPKTPRQEVIAVALDECRIGQKK